MKGLSCDSCGQPVRYLGPIPGTEGNPLEMWECSVCISCRKLYCTKCRPIHSGTMQPDPCPRCHEDLVPGYRNYLSEIGAI